MDSDDQTPWQFDLRYLFVITTWIGVGAALAFNPQLISPVRSVGFSICAYWVAKGMFVESKTLPRIGREIVFLTGLPVFILSLLSMLYGVIGTIGHVVGPL